MPTASGFDAIGKPVPMGRKQRALRAVREMVPDARIEDAMDAVDKMAFWLERDEPYTAQAVVFSGGTKVARDHSAPKAPEGVPSALQLDYTGTLRLFAELLT